ncbi:MULTISPECIES: hypothetical protein [Ramlibacter]|uniref:Uncharacterized protein n=1 Tax=Ramlibacter aquaticus TaxID=2780094 RepID=A0ABR9SIP6_9BURK|nr:MULTISPECIES: hypothetical protein [Ramlibacter]MBE7942168.1 hypothetical protein [Ramlibacter aquaticus]
MSDSHIEEMARRIDGDELLRQRRQFDHCAVQDCARSTPAARPLPHALTGPLGQGDFQPDPVKKVFSAG